MTTSKARTLFPPKVARLVARLPSELHRPWSTTALSAHAGISETELRKVFVAQIGNSPMKFLKRLRLTTASELLRASALPVKEIATAVGFRSPSHFVRDFRQEYGMSPSNYRQELSDHFGAR